MFEKRNYRIDNVELNWAKLAKPVSPFGTLQWELQIATTDKALAKTLSEEHFNVKEKDGKYVVALKRKAVKADGSENRPVTVMDGQKKALDPTIIGNGSIGNVQVFQYPYDTAGRKGVATTLSGVQVVKLVQYNPDNSGFSVVEGADDLSDDELSATDMF
jgi:hypothetical protein